MKIKVGFIYGGVSTEHEISIISAIQAINNIDKEKYDVVPIYISKEGNFYTGNILKNIESYKDLNSLIKKLTEVVIIKKDNTFCLIKTKLPYNAISTIDIFFPVVHGYGTEDGAIAGYLETIGAPFTESDIYASVVGQDKVIQKALLKENGINVTDYIYFYESDYLKNEEKVLLSIDALSYPVIVKPARLGSSVGITKVKNKKDISSAIENALNYDEKIIVEKVVDNLKEYNCSTIGDNFNYEASLIEEVKANDGILSFNDKYLTNSKAKGMASAKRIINPKISKNLKEEIINISIKASKVLNTNGVVRIDYLYDEKNKKLYLNELNIIPGSLSFYLWDIPYKDMLTQIIELGIKKYQNKSKKITNFESNVLKNFNEAKGVKK